MISVFKELEKSGSLIKAVILAGGRKYMCVRVGKVWCEDDKHYANISGDEIDARGFGSNCEATICLNNVAEVIY